MISYSCDNEIEDYPPIIKKVESRRESVKVVIDSTYTYPGDSIYNTWLYDYNTNIQNETTRSLSPEDDAFFNKQNIVKSTEATILYGKSYIYPGSILEFSSISDQKYKPVFVSNRNPITVSTTLAHKPTARIITSPSYSKLSDYVKEMAKGADFQQNEKFMFQYKRFSFYDEIKSAFGTNIDTRKLFSSRTESSIEESHKIVKSTGMYVKFYQSSFTVNMDIAPISNQPIVGSTGLEPVYVNSVTYGRLGVLVFETDETYEFAESCIKKEFDRIFYNKTTTLNQKEKLFYENTEFKVLIIGSDSDYIVQSFKGYGHFLNLIYNSRFTENSFGVPITCSFSYANNHDLVEVEFSNPIYIEPLYVKVSEENQNSYYSSSNGDYQHSAQIYLNFYKDRAKMKPTQPYIDIVFEIYKTTQTARYYSDPKNWHRILVDERNTKEYIKMRNINIKQKIYVGDNKGYHETTGTPPYSSSTPGIVTIWEANEYNQYHYLTSSPFYLIVY